MFAYLELCNCKIIEKHFLHWCNDYVSAWLNIYAWFDNRHLQLELLCCVSHYEADNAVEGC